VEGGAVSLHIFEHDLVPMETPLGPGYAVIVETSAHDYWWTVALADGALVTFSQDRVRMARSYSHRRGIDDRTMKKIISRKRQRPT
jgi:hypothetical protein